MKSIGYPQRRSAIRQSATGRLLTCATILSAFLVPAVFGQEGALSKISGVPGRDSLSQTGVSVNKDSLSANAGTVPGDSSAKKSEPAAKDTLAKNGIAGSDGLTNIVVGNKKVRAYGWGEYRVTGRCLCCDRMNDGDCVLVHTIERTDKQRLNQIVDGNTGGDTSDATTYFGNLKKRDLPEAVTVLMVDMTLGKTYEITKVIVSTFIDKEKHANMLANCELGYYDQFGRLQWTGMVENGAYDQPLVIAMKTPVLTKEIMLKVNGGRSRITEVAVMAGSKKE